MRRKRYTYFFLDRDGVINTDGFVNTPDDFEFLPQSLDALRILKGLANLTFIATNQGGIEAGYLTEETLLEIHEGMKGEIIRTGGWINAIYHCPHLKAECDCRKPKPGMLLQGLKDHNIQDAKDACCFIGDWHTDWQAALSAGIQPIAVSSGRQWGYEQVDFIKTHGIPNYFTLHDAVLALTLGGSRHQRRYPRHH